MKVELNEKEKLAMLWLTNGEREDILLQSQINRDCAKYRQQKYTVAVFCSGKSDLQNVTEGLLLHNQKVAARHDLARAQECEEVQTISV